MALKQIPQHGLAIPADREVKRDRIAGNGPQLLHSLGGSLHTGSDLLIGRSAPQFLLQFPRSPQKLGQALVHVDWDADRTGLIGNSAGDRLPDPPYGVSRELVTALVVEFLR